MRRDVPRFDALPHGLELRRREHFGRRLWIRREVFSLNHFALSVPLRAAGAGGVVVLGCGIRLFDALAVAGVPYGAPAFRR